MNSFGKTFLSAFIEIKQQAKAEQTAMRQAVSILSDNDNQQPAQAGNKFKDHFNMLFAEADHNCPGYYEFSKMITAMSGVSDEKSRYGAAFAGLQVQGLNKQKLLSSADGYLELLKNDSIAFQAIIHEAANEKVKAKKDAVEKAEAMLQQLSQQLQTVQESIASLTEEIADNEKKIYSSSHAYTNTMESLKQEILQTIEKIHQHIL